MEQLINLRDLTLVERQHARQGVFHFYSLVQGKSGTPGSFYMQLGRTYSDFFSPRHRHNFEQVRLQLEGTVSFGRDGVMSPGTVGYFPEGVYYGPQTLEDESYTLVLQFGGASGSGYMSDAVFQAAMNEMKAAGTFEGGVYKVPKPGGGSRNRDAYEAVWEHVNGRRLRYPKPRYDKPLFMESASFEWQPGGMPGLERKHLGTFTECRTEIDLLRIQAGHTVPVDADAVLFVLSGAGTADGKGWEKHSAMYSGTRPGALTVLQTAEVLKVVLPKVAHLAHRAQAPAAAEMALA